MKKPPTYRLTSAHRLLPIHGRVNCTTPDVQAAWELITYHNEPYLPLLHVQFQDEPTNTPSGIPAIVDTCGKQAPHTGLFNMWSRTPNDLGHNAPIQCLVM